MSRTPATLGAMGALLLVASTAVLAQCPSHAHVVGTTQEGNVNTIHCGCDFGYENRGQTCTPTLSMREDTPQQQVERLRDEARSEWHWFTLSQFDVMTAAFWAAYGYDPKARPGEDPDVESMWREARRHLANWLDVQHRIEAITHDKEMARQRYEERVRNFVVARKGSYAVDVSLGTAKADMYPPTDFSPWANDEQARENARCIFVGSAAELACK